MKSKNLSAKTKVRGRNQYGSRPRFVNYTITNASLYWENENHLKTPSGSAKIELLVERNFLFFIFQKKKKSQNEDYKCDGSVGNEKMAKFLRPLLETKKIGFGKFKMVRFSRE